MDTALSRAAQRGHVLIVQYLISKGANVNPKLANSDVLKQVIRSKSLYTLQLLLDAGTKINEFTLQDAFQSGEIAIVQCILQRKPNINTYLFLNPPAYSAILSGNVELLAYLEREESLNIFAPFRYNKDIDTKKQLLQAAAKSGSIEMMRYLLFDRGLLHDCRHESSTKLLVSAILKEAIQEDGMAQRIIGLQERLDFVRFLMEELELTLAEKDLIDVWKDAIYCSSIEMNAYIQSFFPQYHEQRPLLRKLASLGLDELDYSELMQLDQLKLRGRHRDFRDIIKKHIDKLNATASMKRPRENIMIHANKLETIPVADKPLNLGGQIQRLTHEEFKLQFGSDYDEKVELENEKLSFSSFTESIEGRLSSSQLKSQLARLIQHPRDDLTLCKINDEVGYGVFAVNDIPKDTVLCFYSGTLMAGNKTTRDDHAMGISGLNAAVSTQNYRGISSFFQHLPGNPPFPDVKQLLQILHLTGQPVSEKDLMLEDELYSIEFSDNNTRRTLATANIRREYILHNQTPMILFVTNQPIKAGDQLGLKYGYLYWLSRGIAPKLFDKSGAVIPNHQYHRTFWKLKFDGFDYTGDLKPLIEQIKRRVVLVEFKDDMKVNRRLDPSIVAQELIRMHAMTNEEYIALSRPVSSAKSSSALFNESPTQRLMKKYKLPDDSQKSYEKGLRNAAANNFIEDLRLFIDLVSDINAVDKNPKSSRTALIHAARNGHIECYQLLLERGANPDIQDALGSIAAQYLDPSSKLTK